MAALLRQGARRIAGSVLQRTQAALTSPAVVAEERRLLVPRRLYYTEEQATKEITRKVQQKKEELYDLICKAEQSSWTSRFRNKGLLLRLAVQVKPRPEDYKWHLLRVSKRAIDAVEIAGLIALTSYVASAALLFKSVLGDRKEVRRAMLMEEMREAREAETRSGLTENQS